MRTEYEEQVASGQRCEAIKIFYNGVNYKSKLEGKWAAYFNYLGVGAGYEFEDGFPTSAGVYCPDFFIFKSGWFIEVKAHPDLLTEIERDKIEYFKAHLPDWVNGIIIVYGNPENTYDTWFLRDVLGVERTEEEVKNAEYLAVNKTFYSTSPELPERKYLLIDSCESSQEYNRLMAMLIDRKNLGNAVRKCLYGDKETIDRAPYIRINPPYWPCIDFCYSNRYNHSVHPWSNSRVLTVDYPEFTDAPAAYEKIKCELQEFKIKPMSITSAIYVSEPIYSDITSFWDFYVGVGLKGKFRPKLKTSHKLIYPRIGPVTPRGQLGRGFEELKVLVKVIDNFDDFGNFFKMCQYNIKRVADPNTTYYMIFTSDTGYKEQFSSAGVSIITPSDIEV
jgi:hypothetical protein